MSVSYTHEKFYQAVAELIGCGTIQERLARAGQFLLRLAIGGPGGVAFTDPQLMGRFDAVWAKMTAVDAEGGHGRLNASTRDMDDETASQISSEIFSLFMEAAELDKG
jgi:hypothetical protein